MINQPRPQKIGPHPPPPYRAPPPLLQENGAGMMMTPPAVNQHHPYSKFNISEPNITPQRHTFNMENGPQAQSHLRHLLASQPKHSTLDNQGQNAMLQHLRNTLDNNHSSKSFVSPENLRDTANRMFSRNQTDRSSFGGINASFQQQMNMRDDPQKRHSYSNQSFRKAMEQQKVPPRVPPKPAGGSSSRSVSRELLLTDNDRLDAELKHIMKGQQRLSISGTGTTPPLPALSPMPLLDPNHHDSSSPDGRLVLKQRPDLIGEADHKAKNGLRRASKDENLHLMMNGMMNGINGGDHSQTHKSNGSSRLNMTQGAIDIEKVMAAVTNTVEETSDDHEDDGEVTQVSTAIDIGDANQIRKQLDGLENMYGEVLKLLGLRKFGRPAINNSSEKPNGHLRRHKMYGSMSSLPSVSSIGSRHLYKGQKLKAEGGPAHHGKRSSSGTRGERSQNKRFQRLESHVVTLARSVAHLSSEVRNQQIILQEVEALRLEVQQLKSVNATVGGGNNGHNSFFHNPVSPAIANRVKKLTKYFGEEPPLLRLFLKNLGYEKYASVFEEAKIGMLELPYLSEDRLEKLGIPMGPRMRILQESRASLQSLAPLSLVNTTAATTGGSGGPTTDNNNYNVYIL